AAAGAPPRPATGPATATSTSTLTVTSTLTRTPSATPTGTPSPSLTPTLTPSPTLIPAPSLTPAPTATPFFGLTFHVCYPGGCTPTDVVIPGPCPVADNCVEFTITGSFTVVGRLTGLSPAAAVSVTVPVVDPRRRPLRTRTRSCRVH